MANPLSCLLRRLKFWLFEERDYIYTENPKRRRQLHNAYLIQAWAALTGITVVAIIPLVVWLIALPNFVIVYLILSAIAGIFYLTISLYVRHLNKLHELHWE
jgi:hypothetical protein